MATAGVLDDLEELVTCVVCYDRFEGRDPRSLPCLHAYCFVCLKQIYDTAVTKDPNTRDILRCPKCQRVSSIPSEGLDKLPTYFQANQVDEILQRLRAVHSGCLVCKQNDARFYCFNCTRTMCETCKKNHDQNEGFRNHTTVPVDDTTIQSLVCLQHGEMIEAFCTDCMASTCKNCHLSSHSQHTIKGYCEREKEKRGMGEDISSRTENLNAFVQQLDSFETEFEEYIQDTSQSVSRHKIHLLKQIEEQEALLQSQLQKSKDEMKVNISALKAESLELKTRFQILENKNNAFSHPFPQINIHVTDTEDLVGAEAKQIKDAHLVIPKAARYKYIPETLDLFIGYLSEESSAPEIQATVDQISSMTDKMTTHFSEDTNQNLLTQNNGTTSLPCNVHITSQTNVFEILYSSPVYTDTPVVTQLKQKIVTSGNIQCVAFLPNSNILTVEGSFLSNIKIYNHFGLCIPPPIDFDSYNLDEVVVHHASGNIALRSSADDIVVIHEQKDSSWYMHKHKIKDPSGIAFTQDGTELIVGVFQWSGYSLTKYKITGEQVWNNKVDHTCHYIAVDNLGKILVSNRVLGKTVHVYGEDGQAQFSFPYAADKSILQDPRDMCVDSKNNILIVDRKREKVIMFAPTGDYIKDIVSVKGRPKFVDVWNDKLLVVGNEKKELHLFEVNLS